MRLRIFRGGRWILCGLAIAGWNAPVVKADVTAETAPVANEQPTDPPEQTQPAPPSEPAPRDAAPHGNVFRIAPLDQMPLAVPRPRMLQIKLSEYWLGIDCTPLHPAICQHLKLPEAGGLMVEQVVPDSPAAKAGFAQYDLLLDAGDKPITKIEDLMEALDAAQGQPIEFQILRIGDRHKLTVTPEKRPKMAANPANRPLWVDADPTQVFSLVREQLAQSGSPLRIQIFPRGAAPAGAISPLDVPDDLKLRVEKQGKQPAKITVERGEESWTVEEGKLAELPDDVRPHAQALLDRVTAKPHGQVLFHAVPHADAPSNGPLHERLDARMNDLNRRLEQLRGELNELRNRGENRE